MSRVRATAEVVALFLAIAVGNGAPSSSAASSSEYQRQVHAVNKVLGSHSRPKDGSK